MLQCPLGPKWGEMTWKEDPIPGEFLCRDTEQEVAGTAPAPEQSFLRVAMGSLPSLLVAAAMLVSSGSPGE